MPQKKKKIVIPKTINYIIVINFGPELDSFRFVVTKLIALIVG